MAKLDPDNYKSAKDVLDEQEAAERKRKRQQDDEDSTIDGIDVEVPGEGNQRKSKKTKKQKRQEKGDVSLLNDHAAGSRNDLGDDGQKAQDEAAAAAARRKLKRQMKKEKAEKKRAKSKAKKERKGENTSQRNDTVQEAESDLAERSAVSDENLSLEDPIGADDVPNALIAPSSTATPSPSVRSPAFDASENHSASSSISSLPPSRPPDHDVSIPKSTLDRTDSRHITKPDPEELKSRLQSRIEILRSERKADGPNGTPARSRQDLLDARRQKEEARKAHKKELRQKAKEEEAAQKAELLARGSPLLSPGSPLSPSGEANMHGISFGRVDFGNGQRASSNLSDILKPGGRPKGPSDPTTALIAAENRQSRLSGFDPAKQADIAEKDSWLNARKRAQGERMRDDTSLLKKTLKRKQKQKKKSEKEWGDRTEGTRKGQEMRQKRRETNLAKRRDEKGGNGRRSRNPKRALDSKVPLGRRLQVGMVRRRNELVRWIHSQPDSIALYAMFAPSC